ncbi:hypothetical protein Bbelb_208230 [Branchiostoma belcheri]|nr:hypothetical protein Bbelb_208230 [Branchiostoma belcheri]
MDSHLLYSTTRKTNGIETFAPYWREIDGQNSTRREQTLSPRTPWYRPCSAPLFRDNQFTLQFPEKKCKLAEVDSDTPVFVDALGGQGRLAARCALATSQLTRRADASAHGVGSFQRSQSEVTEQGNVHRRDLANQGMLQGEIYFTPTLWSSLSAYRWRRRKPHFQRSALRDLLGLKGSSLLQPQSTTARRTRSCIQADLRATLPVEK